MLRWKDPVSGRELWEPPGGGVESAETPRQAAVRERAEETGIRAAELDNGSVMRWRVLHSSCPMSARPTLDTDGSRSTEFMHCRMALNVRT